MADFNGPPGNIFTEYHPDDDKPWEVWFEDFCILGTGDLEIEALTDAARHTQDIVTLINEAIRITREKETPNANPI